MGVLFGNRRNIKDEFGVLGFGVQSISLRVQGLPYTPNPKL